MGVTAQNVSATLANVIGKSPEGMMAVEYDSMIRPIIESFRELKRKDDHLAAAQEATNHQLEMENTRLEAEIADINKSLIVLKKSP